MEKFNSIKLAMKGPQALVLSIGNQNNSGTDDTVHMMPNTVHMINDRVTSIEILFSYQPIYNNIIAVF